MGSLETWLRGLIAAFISGGASAVTAGVTAPAIAPNAFNFHNQLSPLFELMGALFLVNGALGALAYLKQSPIPAATTTTTEKVTEIQPIGQGVKVNEVTQTTKETK
jgi:hypothetical protein